MGSMGQGRWAMADGPRPMGLKDPGLEDPGLEDPPMGVYFRPEADGAPRAPWASGTPPWGYHLIGVPHGAPGKIHQTFEASAYA